MAATSVVVLDRGNNTTCTVNLHGATVVSWRFSVFPRLWTTFPPARDCSLKANASEIIPHRTGDDRTTVGRGRG
uniref:Uncharacterized protein n=1 Tax=Anopheles quadriannulatus TaxID=34691 RepID=A0A182X883_ANOQN